MAIETDDDLPFPWSLVMTQAWTSYLLGGWGVGAVVIGADRFVLAEGKNSVRAAEGPDGAVNLRHAEIAALEGVNKGQLKASQVYSSLEPCVLCLGALTFCRVPVYRFAARDLSFTPALRYLRQAPVLGPRVPDAQGPVLNEAGAFSRLLSMVAEVENAHTRGRFGLERKLTPRLVALAERCVRERTFKITISQSGDWRSLLDRLSADLAECVPEITRLESRLHSLGLT
jgi:tRNA(Arg) A34 adenosine deaminase TadA